VPVSTWLRDFIGACCSRPLVVLSARLVGASDDATTGDHVNRMTDPPVLVTGGVDTHADVHVVAAVCSTSHRLLATASFAATPAGYVRLLGWLTGFGQLEKVGIEGTGTYGAGLARFLTGEDVELVEVDRPDRAARRQHGKSDPIDAEAAARAVLSGRATGSPKTRDGLVEAIRMLRIVYRGAVKHRSAATNQFHALTLTAPAQIREELQQIGTKQRIERARRWRDRASDDVVARAARQALRELARRIHLLSEQASRTEAELDQLTEQAAPALRDVSGVGVHTAAQLLVTAGDNPHRLRTDGAFAHLCGVAPIPASSGKTRRHRLNQGGDRAANHALWRIAMVRLTHDERTKDYMARRTAEGLSKRDVMRSLKRYIARESFKVLTNPPPPAPNGAEIRRLRTDANLPQRVIAEQFDITIQRLSRIERGLTRDPAMRTRIHAWLTHPTSMPTAA
jgi:transposase